MTTACGGEDDDRLLVEGDIERGGFHAGSAKRARPTRRFIKQSVQIACSRWVYASQILDHMSA
jgi:hypothetical protein